METAGLALAFLVVGGMGVTIGIYIASQIKCHIRKNIFNNNHLLINKPCTGTLHLLFAATKVYSGVTGIT